MLSEYRALLIYTPLYADMRSPFTANGGFEGELSPEDLFNMFFGGGFGGPGFGTGGVQFGQFGGGFGGAPSTHSFILPFFSKN